MIDKILEDREKRFYKTLGIIEKYGLPVICGKINYPGDEKNTEESKRAFHILEGEIKKYFEKYGVYSCRVEGFDGMSILMSVDMIPGEAKKMAVEIEESHPLGRIFDIDIYVKGGFSLSRVDSGSPSRSCIVCGEDARICVRSRRHGTEEVKKTIDRIINEYEDKHGS